MKRRGTGLITGHRNSPVNRSTVDPKGSRGNRQRLTIKALLLQSIAAAAFPLMLLFGLSAGLRILLLLPALGQE